MASPPSPGFRFHEVQALLEAYAAHDYTFTDTPESPGSALSAYLRIASTDPQRVAAAVQQLDDLLRTGLFSPEIADEVALFPEVKPSSGRSVEDCLRIIREHLVRQLQNSTPKSQTLPHNAWERRERFPELNQFLGAYFHQDFSDEYASYKEAIDDYLSGASEHDLDRLLRDITELLTMATTDRYLKQTASDLGMDVSPPPGVGLRQWLNDVAEIVTRQQQK
ncbi:contact-dependent growth inhibition system immunity protein [Streptomyces sp. NPDC005773]|uniref:contact-dependent growth inhibition system immunity protein n=1 Tax=Streptomyces sp. NPDC005773 TaxID=3364727 RepID=UPI0036C050D4